MRRLYLVLSLCSTGIFGQNVQGINSLKKTIFLSAEDIIKVNLYSEIIWDYRWPFPDRKENFAFKKDVRGVIPKGQFPKTLARDGNL